MIKLHILFGTESGEDLCSLFFGQAAQIQLVMIAQKLAPLRSGWPGLGILHRLDKRPGIAAGQGEEEMLIHIEIEHHLQAFAEVSEVLKIGIRKNICFSEDDRPALAPGKELTEAAEHVIFLARPRQVCAFGGNHKGNRVHAKAIDAKLQPEAHDLQNLGLHLRIAGVEVGLKIIEAMKVVCLRGLLVVPCGLLHSGEDDAGCSILWFLLRPNVPLAILRLRIATGLAEPWMLVGGVVHDQVDEDTDTALFAALREFHEIAKRAETRIHAVVVRDVVAAIFAGRWLKRHQPKRRDAHPVEIIKAAHQALEVANAVAVCIHIGGD